MSNEPDTRATGPLDEALVHLAEAKAAQAEAQRVVERWNAAPAAGKGSLWSPTIRAAIAAGTPWVDVFCPGCRTIRAIDVRTIDRHPLASIGSLGLRCSGCPGSAPMPWITRCMPLPPAVPHTATL